MTRRKQHRYLTFEHVVDIHDRILAEIGGLPGFLKKDTLKPPWGACIRDTTVIYSRRPPH